MSGGVPLYFQVHVMIALALFTLWPFTRLVHAFSAPIGYLFRPMSFTAAETWRGRTTWSGRGHPAAAGDDELVAPRECS